MNGPQPCPGCGAVLPQQDGAAHPYMTSSPACWAAFGVVLAAEYQDAALMPVHRLSVDAYAVQHPGSVVSDAALSDGTDRRAIHSVGLHLARLCVQLDRGVSGAEANAAMLRLGRVKERLPRLTPPDRFTVTVADVAALAGGLHHADAVRRWADAAWQDWRHQHDFIRSFLAAQGI